MLNLSLPIEIYFCTQATDMRCSFDGLMQMAQQYVQQEVTNGGLFVFLNRKRDRIKLLYWDTDGLAIWYKRLEAGTFQMPTIHAQTKHITLSATQLALLLGGIDLTSVKHRKRYKKNDKISKLHEPILLEPV